MDIQFDDFISDELVDQCKQVRSIAKKSWLNSTSVSLAHLNDIKAKVYNFGLIDPRDLKATNLRNKKKGSDVPTEPPLSSITERNNIAWRSNNSIPDLVQQHSETTHKPSRPASAKNSGKFLRPPSGKKNRPQSAHEPIQVPYATPDADEETRPGFGVKGAKYDPNGRPPNRFSYTSSVGWVGPPAGLKYPDKPSNGNSWKIDFPLDEEENAKGEESCKEEVLHENMPHPPKATPVPPTPEPEEKTKRIFELYIGDPYKEQDDFIQSDSEEEEFGPTYHASIVTSSAHSRNDDHVLDDESGESFRLNLPTTDDDFDEIDEVDTERLLAEAESVTKKLDLKSIINTNKNIAMSKIGHKSDLTKPNEDIFIPEASSKTKARNLVSEIIDENGLQFSKPGENELLKETPARPALEHERSSVKFCEDVRTVAITPRNIGRKVEEMHHGRKKQTPHQVDGFVDLIEVKNRVEPVLSTSKAELMAHPDRGSSSCSSQMIRSRPNSGSRLNSSSRPPSGKGRTSNKLMNGKTISNENSYIQASHTVTATDSIINQVRPRSAPLNRAPKPITTVTVDYGEAEQQEMKEKVKKRKKKVTDDVETVMGVISKSDRKQKVVNECDHQQTLNKTNEKSECREGVNDSEKDNTMPTVVKSEPERNYYEISRHSSMSNHSVLEENLPISANKSASNTDSSIPVIKTTKTLEFDEVKTKEVTTRNIIDPQVSGTKDKEYFMSSLHVKDESKTRSRLRPSSAKAPASKPPTNEPERPGSRLGFVPMSPSKPTNEKAGDQRTKKISHPISAPLIRSKTELTVEKKSKKKVDRENVNTDKHDVTSELTGKEKMEREKVIDNLLERTRTLLDDCEKKLESEENKTSVSAAKTIRPASAHVGLLARNKDQRRNKSATTKRPVSAITTRHKHYASYSQGTASVKARKSSGKSKPKVVLTEPCIIMSNTPYFTEETEEDLECKELQKNLAEKGLNIDAETLQRALYPPSGKSKYYQITADLPKRSTVSLLSHPKVWLPQEYKNLQKAEKTLSRANEIMFLQKKAEARRAKLEAMGPEERKKIKKKGKKGGKKLRKSQTLG